MKPKTVLVTGASRGIGRSIALAFARAGWHVAINCSSSEDALLSVKKEIEAFGVPCCAHVCDIGDPVACEQLFEIIHNSLGTIHALVNNAGISMIGLLQDLSPADWNRILATNLSSVFYCCRLAIPDMIQAQSGAIVNISSMWGTAGASCEVAYSATKGGVNSFTKALAKELAPSHIPVNAIACGVIDTEMNAFLSPEERQMLIDEIPAGRMGTPEEVAALALQLCENSPYLTGQIIGLDGAYL